MQNRHDRSTTQQTGEAHIDDTIAHQLIDYPTGEKNIVFTVGGPSVWQARDNEICLWPAVPGAMTISKITVTLDAAGNDVAGDLKYADAFIGLANSVVINTFDTASGVLVDSTITSGAVAAGKCIYLSFDSAPAGAITQMCIDIEFSYN